MPDALSNREEEQGREDRAALLDGLRGIAEDSDRLAKESRAVGDLDSAAEADAEGAFVRIAVAELSRPRPSEQLRGAAAAAVEAIDGLFEHLAGLVEDSGGLPLYEAMKPVAEARANLAAAAVSERFRAALSPPPDQGGEEATTYEVGVCPKCGEEEPRDPDAGSIHDADHPRDEHGNLICAECWCELDEAVRYESIAVVPAPPGGEEAVISEAAVEAGQSILEDWLDEVVEERPYSLPSWASRAVLEAALPHLTAHQRDVGREGAVCPSCGGSGFVLLGQPGQEKYGVEPEREVCPGCGDPHGLTFTRNEIEAVLAAFAGLDSHDLRPSLRRPSQAAEIKLQAALNSLPTGEQGEGK